VNEMAEDDKKNADLIHAFLQQASAKAKYIASGQAGLDVAQNVGTFGELPTQSEIVTRTDRLGPYLELLNKLKSGSGI